MEVGMATFLLGAGCGAIIGILTMALCSIQKATESDYLARVDKVRKLAEDTEKSAQATDDAMGMMRAAGLWNAVEVMYGSK
jgi:hypothetical protein